MVGRPSEHQAGGGVRAGSTAATSPAVQAHAADRLLAAIERAAAPVCVGLDPVLVRLPTSLKPRRDEPQTIVAALSSFCLAVLDSVAAHVPCVKPQAACFERYRHLGVEALYQIVAAAHQRGLQVILDAKRGDIGTTAEHYAAGVFGDNSTPEPGGDRPDWVTINSYLGRDGMEPFLRPGFGAMALVRTSNPGGDEIQSRRVADASASATVAEVTARLVAEIGDAWIGTSGFSALGAVVGATKSAEAAALRAVMPRQIILVPGYGAQGAGAADVLPCFDHRRRGAIVTASRSVIYAFEPDDSNWSQAVARAAARFADELGVATGMR